MRVLKAVCACLVLTSAVALAASKNPADYPLRLHIFGRSQTTFYYRRSLDESQGDGRANLFENGEVHGLDFNFVCSQKLRASFGYETYPARWKKPGRQLVVLFPVFGQTGAYYTCDINTDVRDFAYMLRNGHLDSEPVEHFKAWMVTHDYDPEHGKDVPIRTNHDAVQAPAEEQTPAAPPPSPPQ